MASSSLIKNAKIVRNKAYTPYSTFKVGASLLTKSGHVFVGCNVENAAYPVTCCAERVAIFSAISSGKIEFSEMAIVADTIKPVTPCGSCRQVMSEFFSPSMNIHLANLNGLTKTITMEELLPHSFNKSDLANNNNL